MNLNWYNTLNKPALTPPAEIFPPVWAVLYILIFISLILFLTTPSLKNKLLGIFLFTTQMILNLIWSPIFFYFQDIKLAFVIIILMMVFLLFTIISFYKISRMSAYLLVPYFVWICFAAYLNYGFMNLN